MSAPRTPRLRHIAPPAMPPETPEEAAQDTELLRMMEEITETLTQRNLDHAVILAQQAARREGPLVKHFQELGRRFYSVAMKPVPKPGLRVIKGGAA